MGDMAKAIEDSPRQRLASMTGRIALLFALLGTASSVSLAWPEMAGPVNWVCGVLVGWRVVAEPRR